MSIGWYRQQVLTRGSTRRYQSERNLSSCKSTAHHFIPFQVHFPSHTHARTHARITYCMQAGCAMGFRQSYLPAGSKARQGRGRRCGCTRRGLGWDPAFSWGVRVRWLCLGANLCEGGGEGGGARQRGGPWPSSGRRSHGRVLPSDSVWEECRGGSWSGDAGCMGVQKGEG